MRRVLVMVGVLGLLGLGGCSRGATDQASPRPVARATSTTDPVFSGEGRERFCPLVRATDERLSGLSAAGSRPDDVRRLYSAAQQAVEDLADAAPAEVRADVRVIAKAYDEFIGELREARYDPAKVSPDARQKLQSPRVKAAGERLDAYRSKVCPAPS